MNTKLQPQPAEFDAGLIFSGTPSGTSVNGYAEACAHTPELDPDYIFHEACRDIIVWFLNPPSRKADPLYVFGPTGSGKTSCVKQIAARLNYPVFEITGHSRLEFPDLVGHLSVRVPGLPGDQGHAA